MYALRLAFGAILMGMIIASGSLAFESDLVRGVTGGDRAVAVETPDRSALDADLESGDCWTAGGDSDGYPTRMWILKGDTFTEVTAQARIDRVIEGDLEISVYAFCDGVDLTGL